MKKIFITCLLAFITLVSQAQEFGSLIVKTKPDRCRVFLNGNSRGYSPITLSGIIPGRYQLSVWKPGYDILTREVSIEAGKRLVGNIELASCDSVRDALLHDSLHVDRYNPDRNAYVAMEKAPVVVNHAMPVYPDELKKQGVEGKVYLQLLIDHDGSVMRVEVAKSSGSPGLDEAAVAAAKGMLFTPAIAPGNKTVRVWVMYPVTFSLRTSPNQQY